MKRLRESWPHIAYWLCVALVLANTGVALCAPLELAVEAAFRAGGFGLLALFFWVRCHSTEDAP